MRIVMVVGLSIGILLSSCTLEKEVSRVAIPDSKLTLVLTEDEKKMYRYHVYAGGKEVAVPGFFGPHDADSSTRADVSVTDKKVTVRWRGPLNSPSLEINISNCTISQNHGASKQQLDPEYCKI